MGRARARCSGVHDDWLTAGRDVRPDAADVLSRWDGSCACMCMLVCKFKYSMYSTCIVCVMYLSVYALCVTRAAVESVGDGILQQLMQVLEGHAFCCPPPPPPSTSNDEL